MAERDIRLNRAAGDSRTPSDRRSLDFEATFRSIFSSARDDARAAERSSALYPACETSLPAPALSCPACGAPTDVGARQR